MYDPRTDTTDGVSALDRAAGVIPPAPRPDGPNLDHPKRVTVESLRLLHDYLAVAPLSVSMRNAGGLMFIPEAAGVRERSQRGIVLAVGPGDYNDAGTALVPMTTGAGDLVFFGKYAGTEEELGGRLVLIMRENECRVRVPAGDFEVVEHENPKLNHLVEDWCDVCYGDPEADAKARLEVMRQAQADSQNAVCVCGHVGAEHAHLTGPCKQCECMGFQPNELEDTPAQARAELAEVLTDAAIPRRPCAEPGCGFMQRMSAGEWVGAKCGHRHPASVVGGS